MEEIDWSKAPEGATHYQPHQGAYYKHSPLHRCWLVWASNHPMGELRWHQAHGTDEKQLIARPAAWDGTGLPPVGTVCEACWTSPDKYYRIKVLAHDDGKAVYRWLTGPCSGELSESEGGILGKLSKPHPKFRPIRTPEQIVAEERRAAIREMERFFRDGELLHVSLGRLYDAGCRLPGGAQ